MSGTVFELWGGPHDGQRCAVYELPLYVWARNTDPQSAVVAVVIGKYVAGKGARRGKLVWEPTKEAG